MSFLKAQLIFVDRVLHFNESTGKTYTLSGTHSHRILKPNTANSFSLWMAIFFSHFL